MPGLYTHTARIDGESYTAAKLNADHQNHIDNHIPTKMDDYSTDAAQMREQTDPGEQGSESLPTHLAGELQRLRYAIAELKGTTYWYESSSSVLEEANRHNFLVNGGFNVWQRGTTFTAATTPDNGDNTLLMDGWRLLSDGDDIVDVEYGQLGPSDAPDAAKFTIATEDKKWGICQFVESVDSSFFSQGSQKASLSFSARCSSGATATRLRAAIIQWTGTADAPTTDIVSAWEAEGTDPTLVTNWAYASTPSLLTLTSSLDTYTIEGTLTSDSATNIGVFIWADDTANAAGEFVVIAAVQLVRGARVGTFTAEPFSTSLARAQRRFTKTFSYATPPAQNAGRASALYTQASNDGSFVFDWRFPVEMLKAPTITTYNPSAANASAHNISDTTDTAVAIPTGATGTASTALGHDSLDATDANNRMTLHATAAVDF